uniref:Uncharacterized protein n=1 Tax=Anguilla anguilla TaxID=7936 RepID=A0A0E9UIG4_ANGAN
MKLTYFMLVKCTAVKTTPISTAKMEIFR